MKLDPQNCVKVACNGDDNWIVAEPYTYTAPERLGGVTIVVPVGFETDGASVPRCLWSAIPPFGLHFNAAVVHDFLYRQPDGEGKLLKSICDEIFREIMIRDGVPELRREAMYEAVRTMGYSSYTHGKAVAAQLIAGEEAVA